jgi:hypothetical protein
MEQVTLYRTSDGEVFESEAEAKAHDEMLVLEDDLNEYVREMLKAGVTKATAQSRRAGAKAYIEWSTKQAINVPKERKKAAVGKAQKAA